MTEFTKCSRCGRPMPAERLELGFPNCKNCTPQSKPLGFMVYSHKTAGVLELTTDLEAFKRIKTSADKQQD